MTCCTWRSWTAASCRSWRRSWTPAPRSIGSALRDLELPEDSYVVVLVRGERALPARPETRLVNGDKLLAVTSSEHEAELRTLLIGE